MINQITEDDYNRADPIFRVIVHDNPRKFGAILLPGTPHPVVLCWRSDLVPPMIVPDPQTSAVWVGVDQRIVALAAQGNILFSMGLNSNFLQMIPLRHCTVVLCETQVIAINQDYSLRRIIGLREVPDAAMSEDDKLTVTFIDGEAEVFSL